jgi:hypothetical protein
MRWCKKGITRRGRRLVKGVRVKNGKVLLVEKN